MNYNRKQIEFNDYVVLFFYGKYCQRHHIDVILMLQLNRESICTLCILTIDSPCGCGKGGCGGPLSAPEDETLEGGNSMSDEYQGNVRVNIRVSPDVHYYFKQRSEATGASMSALMFLALEKYMNEQQFMSGGIQQLLAMAKAQGLDGKLTEAEKGISEAILDMER